MSLAVFFRREEQGKGSREQFAEFLRLLALRQDGEEEEATDRITLTTIHGAKGLEWRHVFLIGLEEGLMPHARTPTSTSPATGLGSGTSSSARVSTGP